ncbi:MAG TPA: hypothetical protein VNH41_07955 [Steroidobacteraceae bacterium]|nr:hypothetical protein [Steroidobacteraceae bacterium]
MSTLREFRCPKCGYTVECFVTEGHLPIYCAQCHDANVKTLMLRALTPPALRGETVSKG